MLFISRSDDSEIIVTLFNKVEIHFYLNIAMMNLVPYKLLFITTVKKIILSMNEC